MKSLKKKKSSSNPAEAGKEKNLCPYFLSFPPLFVQPPWHALLHTKPIPISGALNLISLPGIPFWFYSDLSSDVILSREILSSSIPFILLYFSSSPMNEYISIYYMCLLTVLTS